MTPYPLSIRPTIDLTEGADASDVHGYLAARLYSEMMKERHLTSTPLDRERFANLALDFADDFLATAKRRNYCP